MYSLIRNFNYSLWRGRILLGWSFKAIKWCL